MDYKEIAARWPQFKEGEIAVFHLQFKTCDLNNDGRIDLYELNYMLDEMEDPTTREERKRLFDEIDRDGSGGVDFDEFLGVRRMCPPLKHYGVARAKQAHTGTHSHAHTHAII
eukprot:Opistho-1_new@50426